MSFSINNLFKVKEIFNEIFEWDLGSRLHQNIIDADIVVLIIYLLSHI